MKNVRIAIIHDWLTGMRGGEKCLEVFCELFPDATLFTLVHNEGSVSPGIENMDIRTSFLQKIPGISRNYRSFLPLFPAAIESFDLSGYELVLSSSHCVAKGARSSPDSLHICYCYTPMRYAWKFFDEYFSEEAPIKQWIISRVIERLKRWDIASNKRIDYFVAISDNVRNRIEEFYGKSADVIYPPVDVDSFAAGEGDDGSYLIVSALVPYKRVDLAVRAFNETKKRLVIVGEGTDLIRLKRTSGENIEFKGWVSDAQLAEYYSKCRALVFPGEEDFGIVPIEAQACGKPVIAFAAGGALETVIPHGGTRRKASGGAPTGVFFYEQTVSALNGAVENFENNRQEFDPGRIRENAARFNRDRFKDEIKNYIRDKWEKYGKFKITKF
ncbi:MAG: glycosyltransferase [Candidatus Omnitrophota bacterium]|nr:glycosyltransferase [Candidatus Omnitrophota bacterium]